MIGNGPGDVKYVLQFLETKLNRLKLRDFPIGFFGRLRTIILVLASWGQQPERRYANCNMIIDGFTDLFAHTTSDALPSGD